MEHYSRELLSEVRRQFDFAPDLPDSVVVDSSLSIVREASGKEIDRELWSRFLQDKLQPRLDEGQIEPKHEKPSVAAMPPDTTSIPELKAAPEDPIFETMVDAYEDGDGDLFKALANEYRDTPSGDMAREFLRQKNSELMRGGEGVPPPWEKDFWYPENYQHWNSALGRTSEAMKALDQDQANQAWSDSLDIRPKMMNMMDKVVNAHQFVKEKTGFDIEERAEFAGELLDTPVTGQGPEIDPNVSRQTTIKDILKAGYGGLIDRPQKAHWAWIANGGLQDLRAVIENTASGAGDPFDITTKPSWYAMTDAFIHPENFQLDTPEQVLQEAIKHDPILESFIDAEMPTDWLPLGLGKKLRGLTATYGLDEASAGKPGRMIAKDYLMLFDPILFFLGDIQAIAAAGRGIRYAKTMNALLRNGIGRVGRDLSQVASQGFPRVPAGAMAGGVEIGEDVAGKMDEIAEIWEAAALKSPKVYDLLSIHDEELANRGFKAMATQGPRGRSNVRFLTELTALRDEGLVGKDANLLEAVESIRKRDPNGVLPEALKALGDELSEQGMSGDEIIQFLEQSDEYLRVARDVRTGLPEIPGIKEELFKGAEEVPEAPLPAKTIKEEIVPIRDEELDQLVDVPFGLGSDVRVATSSGPVSGKIVRYGVDPQSGGTIPRVETPDGQSAWIDPADILTEQASPGLPGHVTDPTHAAGAAYRIEAVDKGTTPSFRIKGPDGKIRRRGFKSSEAAQAKATELGEEGLTVEETATAKKAWRILDSEGTPFGDKEFPRHKDAMGEVDKIVEESARVSPFGAKPSTERPAKVDIVDEAGEVVSTVTGTPAQVNAKVRSINRGKVEPRNDAIAHGEQGRVKTREQHEKGEAAVKNAPAEAKDEPVADISQPKPPKSETQHIQRTEDEIRMMGPNDRLAFGIKHDVQLANFSSNVETIKIVTEMEAFLAGKGPRPARALAPIDPRTGKEVLRVTDDAGPVPGLTSKEDRARELGKNWRTNKDPAPLGLNPTSEEIHAYAEGLESSMTPEDLQKIQAASDKSAAAEAKRKPKAPPKEPRQSGFTKADRKAFLERKSEVSDEGVTTVTGKEEMLGAMEDFFSQDPAPKPKPKPKAKPKPKKPAKKKATPPKKKKK